MTSMTALRRRVRGLGDRPEDLDAPVLVLLALGIATAVLLVVIG